MPNKNIKFFSFNVRNLPYKNIALCRVKFQWILSFNPDVIILTEVAISHKNWGLVMSNIKYMLIDFDIFLNDNPREQRGIMVLIRKRQMLTVNREEVEYINDDIYKVVLSKKDEGRRLILFAVYAPSNRDDPAFFLRLREILMDGTTDEVMIAGDFNTTLDPVIDKWNYKTDPHSKSRIVINDWLEEDDFVDAFRVLNPDAREYTFRGSDGQRGRLDMILLSNKLCGSLFNCRILQTTRKVSDHAAVECTLVLDISESGPGTFRARPGIQKDPRYQACIRHLLQQELLDLSTLDEEQKAAEHNINDEHFNRPAAPYPEQDNRISKDEIVGRGLAIKTSSALDYVIHKAGRLTKRLQNMRTKNYEERVNEITNALSEIELENQEQRIVLEAQLNDVLDDQYEEQTEFLDNLKLNADEKASKQMLAMEKNTGGYVNISRIRAPNPDFVSNIETPDVPRNKILVNPAEVRSHMRKFMQDIYLEQSATTPEMEHVESFLKDKESDNEKITNAIKSRTLTEEEKQLLEGKLTKKELSEQLKVMKPMSSPGLDGFTIAWLKEFWPELADLCVAAVNNCYDLEVLTPMLSQAIMKIIPKGSKDPLEPGNYRPISLLSIFYKVASGALTRRLKKVYEKVIGKEQKAYSKMRNIGSVLINLLNAMSFVNKRKIETLIVALDFQKAFDSINTQFIDSALKTFNFGEDFRKWVKLMFTNRGTYLLLDGYLGDRIMLEQGVPQGDILSPYIFNICVEILLIKIANTSLLEGIIFAKKEWRLEAYADDTTVVIKRSEENLRNLLNIIKDFSKISGLHANIQKTTIIPCGGNFSIEEEDQLCKEFNLKWQSSFTLLGIVIDSRLEKLQDNLETKLLKVSSLAAKWRMRKLTLRGRVAIAKCTLISQLVYPLTILDCLQSNCISKLQDLVNSFIRNSSRPWISSKMMMSHARKGGVGLFNIEQFVKAIKTSWIRRYLQGLDDHWTDILDEKLNLTKETRLEINRIGDMKIDSIAEGMDNPVLKEVLKAYAETLRNFPTNPETNDNSWLNQPFFQNSRIKAKIPQRSRSKIKTLDPTDFGIENTNLNLRLSELYSGGRPKNKEELQETCRASLHSEDFSLSENSFLRIKNCLNYILGQKEKYDGVKRCYSGVLPIMTPNPPKYSSASLGALLHKLTQGSSRVRAILSRGDASPIDDNRVKSWRRTWENPQISRDDVEKTLIFINHPDFIARANDILTRLYLRKSLFGLQLHKIYPNPALRPEWAENVECKRCLDARKLYGTQDVISVNSPVHFLVTCPLVENLRENVLSMFDVTLPRRTNPQDILIYCTGYKPCDFIGNYLNASITVEMMDTKEKIPNTENIGIEIFKELTMIRKHKPNSKISKLMAEHGTLELFHEPRPPDRMP